jgi:hypothetical protein
MRTIVTLLTIATLFAAATPAQEADRVLHFSATKSPNGIEAIATVIQVTTNIPKVAVDASEQSLALRGTAEQVALAEWLFTNLDKPTNVPPSGAKHEYRMSDSADDMVRLFYLKNPEIPTGVQEIATAVRSLVDVRQMFTYNELRAVAVRGTEEQIRAVEFVFNAMDKPAIQRGQNLQCSASPEFHMREPPFNTVRVFYLPNTKTVRDFQEVVTLVRSISYLRYAFTYNAADAVAVRGTDDQLALAKSLFENLDAASATASGINDEYRVSAGTDEFVRIFYLTHATTPERLQETANRVRSKTGIRNLFTYNAPHAIVLRDTTENLALAARLIQEQDK